MDGRGPESSDDDENLDLLVDGAKDETSSEEEEEEELWKGPAKAVLAACGGCCMCQLLVLAILVYVGWTQVSKAHNTDGWHDARVTPPEFPRYMGCGACDAGVKTNEEIKKCVEPCFSLDFVLRWEAFAKSHGYKLVYFPSRVGPQGEPPVNISAWWLPADTSNLPPGYTPPRVVALHGLASNCNHCGVQGSCFHLRTLGFSCLTPSVRDYGLSGSSSHPGIMTWGYDYHMDLLGAWDFAVQDPRGELGGPLPPDQVGIMGFSKGALATAIAFSMEKRIPGAWVDSAPYRGLYGMIDAYVRGYAGILTPLIRQPVWWAANFFAGVPLDHYTPLQLFGNCTPPRRRIAISHGNVDEMVPPYQSGEAMFQLGGHPECYDLWIYTPTEDCDGANHHVEMWQYPDETRARFCYFWSKVFNRSYSLCGLERYPSLDMHPTKRP